MPAIMVAGTTSNAGKSAIATALCRILSKRGYSVAPFKAQNMSLNSYVTKDGKEVAIAQAIQARAAGIEVDERMNPILLKPKGNFVSQLVLMGKALKDVSSEEYYNMIGRLKEVVEKAYRELEKEFDFVVIEGAGGIAEINLYERDLSNTFMARVARPKILVVGDIDRGGVFASLYGSYWLLPEDVRELISGFIINRLRGRADILESGIRKLEELTGVRVLGVIPFAESVFSEDSLCMDEWGKDAPAGILKLDKVSNFTDFEPIRSVCTFVSKAEELRNIELLFIPGSKNTIRDLELIKNRGLDGEIRKFAKNRPVIGICGGYQMLGREITDSGVEHGFYRVKGLQLLDVATEFRSYSKVCRRVERIAIGDAIILEDIRGESVKGYEIHKGATAVRGKPAFKDENGFEGCVSEDGLTWGTYTHALFWNENVVKAVANYLGVKISYMSFEDRIERFARLVEKCLDLDSVI